MFYRTEQNMCPGGSAQNTIRILQWLCDDSHKSPIGTFHGGLGNDHNGSILEKLVRISGVDTRFVFIS